MPPPRGFPHSRRDALRQLKLTGVNISQHPLTHAFPTFNFTAGTSFTPIGSDKAGITKSNTYQFTDNVTFSRGKHTLKAGIDVRRVRYFDLESFAPEFDSDDFGTSLSGPLPVTPSAISSLASPPRCTLPSPAQCRRYRQAVQLLRAG